MGDVRLTEGLPDDIHPPQCAGWRTDGERDLWFDGSHCNCHHRSQPVCDDLVAQLRELAPRMKTPGLQKLIMNSADEIERLQAENDAWRGDVINDELLWEDVINALRARGFQRQNDPRQNRPTNIAANVELTAAWLRTHPRQSMRMTMSKDELRRLRIIRNRLRYGWLGRLPCLVGRHLWTRWRTVQHRFVQVTPNGPKILPATYDPAENPLVANVHSWPFDPRRERHCNRCGKSETRPLLRQRRVKEPIDA